jgi:hypothetical protein
MNGNRPSEVFPNGRGARAPGARAGEDVGDPALERIWLAAQSLEWRSLALVPASDGVSVIEVAHTFSMLGLRDRGESIGVADLRAVPCTDLRGPIEIVRWHIRRGERVILALTSCFHSIATIPLGRAADCAILCVELGRTRIAEATETVGQIGRERFIGTLLVRPSRESDASGPDAPRRLYGYR